MHTTVVLLEFMMMVFAPCLVATHAMVGEGPELGYDETLRWLRAKALETYLKLKDSLRI